jgi:hypothetical protein
MTAPPFSRSKEEERTTTMTKEMVATHKTDI